MTETRPSSGTARHGCRCLASSAGYPAGGGAPAPLPESGLSALRLGGGLRGDRGRQRLRGAAAAVFPTTSWEHGRVGPEVSAGLIRVVASGQMESRGRAEACTHLAGSQARSSIVLQPRHPAHLNSGAPNLQRSTSPRLQRSSSHLLNELKTQYLQHSANPAYQQYCTHSFLLSCDPAPAAIFWPRDCARSAHGAGGKKSHIGPLRLAWGVPPHARHIGTGVTRGRPRRQLSQGRDCPFWPADHRALPK